MKPALNREREREREGGSVHKSATNLMAGVGAKGKKTGDSFLRLHGIAPQQYPFHCILHVTRGAYAI